ncbi:hypothetical protein KIPB_005551, partial [Kipferlia bialata]|eukprot:g5551.t1
MPEKDSEERDITEVDLTNKTAFEVLGVPTDCEDDTLIKKKYRNMSREYHPDKQRTPEGKAAGDKAMKVINASYSQIKTADARIVYRAVIKGT